jgi:hypothetical protein
MSEFRFGKTNIVVDVVLNRHGKICKVYENSVAGPVVISDEIKVGSVVKFHNLPKSDKMENFNRPATVKFGRVTCVTETAFEVNEFGTSVAFELIYHHHARLSSDREYAQSKFKIGDRVVVQQPTVLSDDDCAGSLYSRYWTSAKKKEIGKTFTVSAIDPDGDVSLENQKNLWSPDFLRKAQEQKNTAPQSQAASFQVGDYVVCDEIHNVAEPPSWQSDMDCIVNIPGKIIGTHNSGIFTVLFCTPISGGHRTFQFKGDWLKKITSEQEQNLKVLHDAANKLEKSGISANEIVATVKRWVVKTQDSACDSSKFVAPLVNATESGMAPADIRAQVESVLGKRKDDDVECSD